MAAHSVEMIGQPNDEDDSESNGGIVEEFTHDSLHADQRQYDGEERRSAEASARVELQQVQNVDWKMRKCA